MRTRHPLTFRRTLLRALALHLVWFALLAAWLVVRALTTDPNTTTLIH